MAMEYYEKLLESGLFSDVIFSVEEEVFKAHRCILSIRSPVFLDILRGSSDETEIKISNVKPSLFKEFLEYLYTNKLSLKENNWAQILYLADKYKVSELKDKCVLFVENNCSIRKAIGFFSEAWKNGVLRHVDCIKRVIVFSPDKPFNSDSFLDIPSAEALYELYSSDIFNYEEIDLFRAAIRWASAKAESPSAAQLRELIGPALYAIRFPRIPLFNFENEVLPSGILIQKEAVDIFLKRNNLNKTAIDFSSCPRLKSCVRFDFNKTHPNLSNKQHAFRFEVDVEVQIHGYGMYYHSSLASCRLSGEITLTSEDGNLLGKATFDFNCGASNSTKFKKNILYFDSPICIKPKTLYTASLVLDSIPQNAIIGIDGKSSVNAFGVEWKFRNAPSSSETSVNGGQIPEIFFTRLNECD